MKFTVTNQADNLIHQTRAHHGQLSSMADVKASTLITLSSVLLTISVPRVHRDGSNAALIVLMVFSLLTILLASYSAMPKYEGRKRRKVPEGSTSPAFNVLFYGHFSEVSYEEYKKEMEIVLNSADLSYEAQLREIHSIGQYLASTKYRFLRLAYLSFMTGLGTSLVTFLALR